MVRSRTTVLAAAAAAVAAAGLSTVAVARPPRATATAVGVSEREFRVAVYRTTVPPGIVRFNVANAGEDVHDLVVRTVGGRTVARSGELRAGERATLSARLAPGTYRLLCTLADHARRGMRATIHVRVPR